ncbi:hypothetical protein OHV05_36335 (plasmid) [Kitasatospora sp. NBC_00070]|uniref:hypothetical protein n=1 Tax=Kitasatospora sp. NBC_00070 TaxID=2975962 RepID=UPI002F910D00
MNAKRGIVAVAVAAAALFAGASAASAAPTAAPWSESSCSAKVTSSVYKTPSVNSKVVGSIAPGTPVSKISRVIPINGPVVYQVSSRDAVTGKPVSGYVVAKDFNCR